MSIATSNEQLALRDAIRDWTRRSGPVSLVRARESGTHAPDKRYWEELASLGVFAITLPEEAGGAGGTIADLAAALEELALNLAPGPILPTLLATLALAPHADHPLLPSLAEGTATATVAPSDEWPVDTAIPVAKGHSSPQERAERGEREEIGAVEAQGVRGAPTGRRLADGSLVVSGITGPVLSGGPGAFLLGAAAAGDGDAWFLLPPDHPGVRITERAPVDFSRPLATIEYRDVVIAPGQLVPEVSTGRVQALAATLFSVEAAGVARWCCDTAAAYARTRRQFGRAIGEFQAVKHLCATMLCRAEEAAALAWDAARAADETAGETADGHAGHAGHHTAGHHDEFSLAASAAAARTLDAAVDNAKDCIQVLGGIGFTWEHDAHLYLRRALALRHLLGGGPRWRERTAGLALRGARRRLAPDAGEAAPEDDRPNLMVGVWAGRAIAQYGTHAQKERFGGPTEAGEITWCQLFSEPEAGSDLASLRTKATRTGDGWLLTGQKVWTSLAHEADWAICVARTDPEVPKHKGLTFFLVDMASAGIDIRPLREMTGRALFNEVFLDEVFVPDDCVLGQPGEGWRVVRATLAAERVAMARGSSFGEEVESLLTRVRAAGLTADRRVLEKIGGLVSDALGGSLLDVRLALARSSGTDHGDSAATRKLLGVAHRQSVAETALDLCGPEGAAADGIAADPVQEFLLSRCLSIAGGTTQILLSVVAERVLALPREGTH